MVMIEFGIFRRTRSPEFSPSYSLLLCMGPKAIVPVLALKVFFPAGETISKKIGVCAAKAEFRALRYMWPYASPLFSELFGESFY